MQKKIWELSLIILLILSVPIGVYADIRKENIELYLVIDKSKSMIEEISDVTDYINRTFVKDFLISGDRLVLIQFYGKADLIYDGIVSNSNKNNIMSDISNIPANGRFTDIGNALDTLNNTLDTRAGLEVRKYLILLTDGKQEAPPESPYYTPDGSFNHRFLDNTKIIQKSGWKIMILGIGQETAVEALAEELGTTHETLDFTAEIPVQKTTSEIIGRVISSNLEIENGVLRMVLRSEGYNTSRKIEIEQILFQHSSGNYPLLSEKVTIAIASEAEINVEISLSKERISKIIKSEELGSLLFNFSGDTPFLPAVYESIAISTFNSNDILDNGTESSANSENNKFNWLIIVIIIAVIAAIIAFIIVRNLIFHRDDEEGKIKKNDEISVDR